MIDHDRLFKELLSQFFWDFLLAFIPELAAYSEPESITFVDKEVFGETGSDDNMEADLIAKLKKRNSEEHFLIHVELQSKAQPNFCHRIFRYFARLQELHKLPVYPVALFSFEKPKSPQPSIYELTFPGMKVFQFQFKLIQLNCLSWQDYKKTDNPVLAALLPKMQLAEKDRVEVKLLSMRIIARLKLGASRRRFLADFVDTYINLDRVEAQQFNSLLAELNPTEKEEIMEVYNTWVEEGIQKGITIGREEGRNSEAFTLVHMVSTRILGAVPEHLSERIRLLSTDKLEKLLGDLLSFKSPDDLKNWLANELRD